MTTLPLEKISDASEDFLLQSYPQFLRRFCRHPVVVGLLFVCFSILIYGIPTLILGGFSAGAKVNLTQDWGFYCFLLLGFGAFYYYFRMPTLFSAMLTRLRDNGVFTSDEIEIGERVSRLAQDPRLRTVPFVFPAVMGMLQLFIFPPTTTKHLFWYDVHPISGLSIVVSWMALWVALSGVVICIAMSGITLNSIFTNNKVKVHSLHPDKSGGFNPVGDFSFKLTILALLPGIFIVVVVGQSIATDIIRFNYLVFVLNAMAYLIIVPMLFYLPIRGAHKAMVAFRDNLIKQTYSRYSVENQSKYDPQNEETLTNVKGAVEQMDILKRLAKHESSYPVWPFGYRTRIGVFLNAVFPLACTLAGVFVDNMLRS
jgi:hypothetical protein